MAQQLYLWLNRCRRFDRLNLGAPGSFYNVCLLSASLVWCLAETTFEKICKGCTPGFCFWDFNVLFAHKSVCHLHVTLTPASSLPVYALHTSSIFLLLQNTNIGVDCRCWAPWGRSFPRWSPTSHDAGSCASVATFSKQSITIVMFCLIPVSCKVTPMVVALAAAVANTAGLVEPSDFRDLSDWVPVLKPLSSVCC